MKALISTIRPIDGGVPRMVDFVARTLESGGIEPVLAYYQPYSLAPEMSVPLYCLPYRRVKSRVESGGREERHAIGAWLPELEFTHYLPTKHWKAVIAECDYHLSVSGNCLAATPFALQNVPYWAWVATPWHEDREQRTHGYPLLRRLLDRWIITQGARWLERRVLDAGTIVALSEYTRERLQRLTSRSRHIDVMPMAIDTHRFKPAARAQRRRKRIGFVGRLTDPRKNVSLLLGAAAWCRGNGLPDLELLLIGGSGKALEQSIRDHGLGDAVTVIDNIDNGELPAHLNTLDLFVVPSHQEGLCIAALEAMACGVPVVSTRCGGPEEFVKDHVTGRVTEKIPELMGKAILELLSGQTRRSRLAANARQLVEDKYSKGAAQKTFWETFSSAFATNSAMVAGAAASRSQVEGIAPRDPASRSPDWQPRH